MAGRLIRVLQPEDLPLLEVIDRFYAESCQLEPVVSAGSLNFYARTGHSFVSLQADRMTGFVLAQAIWNGNRPAIQVYRLAVADMADEDSRASLVEALTKSAYDAAVYDLLVLQPASDAAGSQIWQQKGYREKPLRLFERILGSRGQGG
jgi:hypothetical protein